MRLLLMSQSKKMSVKTAIAEGIWAGCSAQSLEQKLCKNENIDN